MDGSKPHLKISGPLLSKLLHEKYKATGICGGLLYGEIVAHARSEITDSQHTTRTELHARVQDYISKPAFEILGNKAKNEAWIEHSCSPRSDCIGIFKIRKPPMNLSLLEKSMHRQFLRQQQREGNGARCHKFIVTLLVTCHTEIGGTCLTWRIAAYTFLNGCFTTIEVDVSNLQGSVSSSYMTGPSPVTAIESPRTSEILQTFHTSLIDSKGQIKVVSITRETTSSLISELESAFSKLHDAERKLNRAIEERQTLLDRLRTLKDVKLLVTPPQASVASAATIPKELRVVVNRMDLPKSGMDLAREMNGDTAALYQSESEYLAKRRKSIEDMQKRSAVVVLENLNINKTLVEKEAQKYERSIATHNDPFTGLVLSAEEKLKSDIATLADEAPSDQTRNTEATWDSEYVVKAQLAKGHSESPRSHKDEG